MERVLEVIRKDVDNAERVRVDTPTQNLESYFLDVVRKAREAAAKTSGATSGATVAAYLRGGDAQLELHSLGVSVRLGVLYEDP